MKFMVDWREWDNEERTHKNKVRLIDAESAKEAKLKVADEIGYDKATNVERF